MKRNLWIAVLLVIIGSLLSNCATILDEGNQKLTVETTPSRADITVENSKGETIITASSPCAIELKGKGIGPFTIEANSSNYMPEKRTLKKKFKHVFWFNFLISGISIGGGLAYKAIIAENATAEYRKTTNILSYAIMGAGGGAGLIGALYDVLSGNTYGFDESKIEIPLKMTTEAIAAQEAQARAEAQQREEAEAKRKAEAEAKAAALAAENETKFNPNGLDRSKYKNISVEDFSFDMVAGKLSVGTKLAFSAKFLTKPTGTSYLLHGVNGALTLSTTNNFIRNMPNKCFESTRNLYGGWDEQVYVKVYVTVKRTGQLGECSVDIVEW